MNRRHLRIAYAVGALALAGTAFAALDAPVRNPYYDPTKAHHTPTGFRNRYLDIEPSGFWKWQWERWTTGVPRTPPDGWHFPVLHPDAAALAANGTVPTVTWIGHATVLLQMGGSNVLTDPQFSERASPFSFVGPKRVVPPAMALEDLPHIDVVVISHNHYDHLDEASVITLSKQNGGPPRFVVPLGIGAWLRERGIDSVDEIDWWDSRTIGALTVHLVPVQHWSARTPWDRNETLWGGFVLDAPGLRVFHSGDTGYSRDFADIHERYGDFDLTLLPIGAYAPRWFMARQHIDPAEAVQIMRDLHARRALAVHWGTFVLTDEDLDEPPRKLAEALDAAGVARDAFWVLQHGETRALMPPTRTAQR